MNKFILFLLLLIAILVCVIADLVKRGRDGIPDPVKTGIITRCGDEGLKAGAGAADISPFLESDKRLEGTGLPGERDVNLFLELLEPPKDSARVQKRKIVNRLFIKCLLFSNGRDHYAAVLSVDLPLLTEAHIQAMAASLKARFGLDRNALFIHTPGLLNTFTMDPARLAECAVKCADDAVKNLEVVEFACLAPEKQARPANTGLVDLPGVGTLMAPPLCGPILDNRAYDASSAADRWILTLSGKASPTPPMTLRTEPFTGPAYSMVIFRKTGGAIIGGMVLSAVTPCITPPAKCREDISADYVYHLCDFLERKTGGTFLFARMPGAEVIPFIDAFSHPSAHRYGTSAGSALAQQIRSAVWEKPEISRFYSMAVRLPLKEEAGLDTAALARRFAQYRAQAEALKNVDVDLLIKREVQDKYLTAHYLSAHFSRFGRPAEPAIRAFRLNRFLFLSLPGGQFLEAASAVRPPSPRNVICIADHADGYISDMVPRRAWNGGFAPNRAVYGPGAAEALLDGANRLLREISIKKDREP